MFQYHPDTQTVARANGEVIGTCHPETGIVRLVVELSQSRRSRLKKALLESGLAVRGFEVVLPEPEGEAPVSAADVPPCPPEDPRYGDKTVAVVAWFKAYRPGEFVRRYAGRRIMEPLMGKPLMEH